MRYSVLLTILVLLMANISVAWSEEVREFSENDVINPDDVASMLIGNTAAPAPTKTLPPETRGSSSHSSSVRTRGIVLDSFASKYTPKPAPVAKTAASATPKVTKSRRKSFSLPIEFAVNSASIMPKFRSKLTSVGKGIKQAGIKVVVEGHTDVSGNDHSNLRLSRMRANAVRRYLVDNCDIDPGKLVAVGKGSSELLYPQNPTSSRNRRVQFRAYK
jgi:outer membrane protein OmpA-like peptidoglycan-associated protein